MTEDSKSRYRVLPPAILSVVHVMAFILIVAGALFALEVHSLIGFTFFPQQFFGFVVGLVVAIIFLLVPSYAGQDRRLLPWYDLVLAGLGLLCGLYVTLWFPKVAYILNFPSLDRTVLGTITILLILEASRRVFGPVLPVVAIAFIGYASFADLFPNMFQTRAIPWERLSNELYLGPSGMLGLPTAIISTVVLVFILFGHLMFAMGGGTLFIDLAAALMGRYRGGPAKVAVLGSALFGSISGSAVANVAITGTVTIPMMKRLGYRPEVAGAVEATASTAGMVTPPVMSATAFLMAEFLEIPYSQVILAAAIPALLLYMAIILQVDLEAGRSGMKGLSADQIPRVGRVLRKGWPFLLPVPVLVFTLIGLNWQPPQSGMFSVLVLIASGCWFVRSKGVRWWYDVISKAGIAVAEIIVIGALVGLIMGCSEFTGLGFTLSLPLVKVGDYNMFLFLLVTAGISIILGMGLPGIAIYLMQTALIVPSLIKSGVEPIAAHLFIMYFGVFSMITPPVCISAITAAGIAEASPMKTGWEAAKLGIVAFIIPFLFVLSPALIGKGSVSRIVADFVTAGIGIVALCAGLRGYFLRPIGLAVRALAILGAVGLMLPTSGLTGAWAYNIAGFFLLALVFITILRASRSEIKDLA